MSGNDLTWLIPQKIQPNPHGWAEMTIMQWFVELERGERQATSEAVPVEMVRSNPFTVALRRDGVVESIESRLRAREAARLFVAQMPDWSPCGRGRTCEAVKRCGMTRVDVQVIGSLSEQDCARIGLV